MPRIIDGVRQGDRPRGTFELLEDISTILGTTADTFWPFLESVGSQIVAYKDTDRDLTSSDGVARTLESEFAPFRHSGGVHSYYFDVTGDQHLAGVDIDDFSRVDGAISVGCWGLSLVVGSVALVAKWDNVSAEAREWILWINASNVLEWQEYDESANANIRRESNLTLVQGVWTFYVGTGAGDNAEANLHTYIDGVLDDGAATKSGSHDKMEALAAPVLVGALNVTAAPAQKWNGRLALPFVTGKELSATEILQLYQIGKELLGV